MAEHAHAGFHELIYVVHGAIETRILGQVLCGQRGDALLYPQGAAHSERAVGSEPLETIFLAWTGQLPAHFTADEIPLRIHDRAGRIAMLVEWIGETGAPLVSPRTGLAGLLLSALLDEYARLSQSAGQARVDIARDYIRRHLSEPIDLEQIAAAVGLSKYHFSREFKRLTGETPMAALRAERVAAARSLLLSTPWKLHFIATQVGFPDEYQLSRVFKRVTGVSPGKIRE